MSKTILIHSFRHGVGRSNIVANLAFLLAAAGRRVAIIDTNTDLPAVHLLFGLKEAEFTFSFNDYLLGKCRIEQAALDITSHFENKIQGQLFLIPGNINYTGPAQHLNEAQDVNMLNMGCQQLTDVLKLDALFIDTQPGINATSLVTVTVSDTLVIILRLNQHDYQGTSVTMDVVRQLDVPHIVLIINEAPATFDFKDIKTKIEQTYKCEVAAILPYVDEMTALANQDIFALRYPQHPLTSTLKEAAFSLTSS